MQGDDRPQQVKPTRQRVAIRDVRPRVEDGRFPAKAVAGRPVTVSADVYADSHDLLTGVLRWRAGGARRWREVALEAGDHDRWSGSFTPPEPGRYQYTLQAWIDRFGTWRRDLRTKHEAGVAEHADWALGAQLLRSLAAAATADDAERLQAAADRLVGDAPAGQRLSAATDEQLAELVAAVDPRPHASDYDRVLRLQVDRPRARFSTWYELFPRSTGPPGRHGTFRDVIDRLDHVAGMGFDVLYLPPVHPIGTSNRKGPDNIAGAGPDDPGSPWAIGSGQGGHKAIHPELGTMEDFTALVEACERAGMELALDIAFQCSPDHPYVHEHPEWFRHRPDGSIQYAENPPKKYEDIYPFDFETDDVEGLWQELKSIFAFWIDAGVEIFRVDNPHTKSFPFWEWCIEELTREHPGVILLSEAFTRPKVMTELAKRGFTQSYTYFPWRQHARELREYHQQLSSPPMADYFRGNAWPTTPDILTEQLQAGGRPRFVQRLVLAATLSANYGIYGPAFELMLDEAREEADEYARNEKYEIRDWPEEPSDSLEEIIGRVNTIRHAHPALQSDRGLHFHDIDNDQLLVYSKAAGGHGRPTDVILVAVNLDPDWTQSGFTGLDLEALGVAQGGAFEVHDLLGGQRFTWEGARNYVELDPHIAPAHILQVRTVGAGDDSAGLR